MTEPSPTKAAQQLRNELGEEPWTWEKIQLAFAKVSGNIESVMETEQGYKGPARNAPEAAEPLTVEACLKELREMFPDWPSAVEITTDGIFRILFWPSEKATIKEMCSGRSFNECMAKVRAWKEQQQQ